MITALGLLLACSLDLQIPDGAVQDVAREVCKVGHPTAAFQGARVVGVSAGTGDPVGSVDVAVDYQGLLGHKTRTMTVRFNVVSLDPCEVRTEVREDTGTNPPVLLDNRVASPIVGGKVCALFE